MQYAELCAFARNGERSHDSEKSNIPTFDQYIVEGISIVPRDIFNKNSNFGSGYQNYQHRYHWTDREFAVWMRFAFDFPKVDGKTVIFGHTTTKRYQICNPMQIWHGDGWIGIDCGSSYPEQGDVWSGYFGRLACLRLDDMKEFYSEEPFEPEE